jgi:hypothetical protein
MALNKNPDGMSTFIQSPIHDLFFHHTGQSCRRFEIQPLEYMHGVAPLDGIVLAPPPQVEFSSAFKATCAARPRDRRMSGF